MAYTTITTWDLHAETDWDLFLHTMREHRLPALIRLGATRVTVIRTSDRTAAAISEWPDERTRNDADGMIDKVRKEIHSDGSRLTGEMRGKVLADTAEMELES